MNPFFSIIIPVYNVAQYLRECLDSVLAQTFTDWEAICVDDGSSDGSGDVLDEYAKRDRRFIVIHQENLGVGKARNLALEMVSGKWLMFLDADDIYRNNALAECKHVISRCSGVEVVRFNYQEFTGDGQCQWDNLEKRQICQYDFKDKVTPESYNGGFVGGVYLYQPIRNIRFMPYRFGEDRVWLAEVVDAISKGVRLNIALYGYRQHIESAVHKEWDEKRFSEEVAWRIALLRIWCRSKKRVDSTMLHNFASVITEWFSSMYFSLPKGSRMKAFNDWLYAMKECSDSGKFSVYYTFLMCANFYCKAQLFTWLTCRLPYWLKCHGIHR